MRSIVHKPFESEYRKRLFSRRLRMRLSITVGVHVLVRDMLPSMVPSFAERERLVPNQLRIVAIDDDADDMLFLKRAARRIGDFDIELIPFRVPDEGIQYATTHTVDALIVDYGLGGTDGGEVVSKLVAAGVDFPIIVLTGTDSTELAVNLIHRGATDFLAKSRLSEESLRRSLINAIDKCALQRQVSKHRLEIEAKNDELRARNDEISRFYHHISHELKTPLTSAREFVAIVLDGLAGPLTDEQREYLEISKGSCDELVRHLNDLLDVTRLETGKLNLRVADHDLRAIVELAVKTMQPSAAKSELGLTVSVPADACLTSVDESRVRQVLTNIIGNAIKFTDAGGTIEVRLEHEDSGWGVSISDTGRGIPEEHHAHIFDRLYQVADEDGFIGGMGIGLNLCREITRLHGGEISITSEVDEGSCFTVSLPRRERSSETTHAA